jgi:hypothetical protein
MEANDVRDHVLEHVLENVSYANCLMGLGQPKPTQDLRGRFMVAGYNGEAALGRVGYCVQIRRKQGQFGSDCVWLRLADGSLTIHQNNSYMSISIEDEALIRPFFVHLPEDEDYEDGFHIQGCPDSMRTEFIVEPDEDFVPRGGEGASMVIRERHEDGTEKSTHITFL